MTCSASYDIGKDERGGVSVVSPEGVVFCITYAADQDAGQLEQLIEDVNRRLGRVINAYHDTEERVII